MCSSDLGFQQELNVAPTAIVLTFDQIVSFPAVEVLDQAGHNWALPATLNDTTVRARVRHLPRGNYTVRWHALSADSHVVSGVWTFGVGVPALPPTEAYGASGPTRTEHIVRWLYFGALAMVIGTLGVRLLCLRGLAVPPALEKRVLLLAGLGTAAFLELGILAFCLRCEDVLQLPFGKFLYGDLSPISGGTRFGTAFIAMTLGFALVAAFVYLSWLLDRVDLLARSEAELLRLVEAGLAPRLDADAERSDGARHVDRTARGLLGDPRALDVDLAHEIGRAHV